MQRTVSKMERKKVMNEWMKKDKQIKIHWEGCKQ